MFTDATLDKYGREYNDAKLKGDTKGMEAAHNKAENYRKQKDPSYKGSNDGSTYKNNGTTTISTGGTTYDSSASALGSIPEYNLAGGENAFFQPFLNIGSTITTATDGLKAATEKFFSLVMFWLPWAFVAVFFVNIVKSKAKVNAGPLSVSAGK